MQEASTSVSPRANRSGSQTNRSSLQQDWPRVSVVSPRGLRQAVVTLELSPESQDRGLRQQVGRRRRAQARAAAYARWHHGPAPMAARPIPAALPTPEPAGLDGEASALSHLCVQHQPRCWQCHMAMTSVMFQQQDCPASASGCRSLSCMGIRACSMCLELSLSAPLSYHGCKVPKASALSPMNASISGTQSRSLKAGCRACRLTAPTGELAIPLRHRLWHVSSRRACMRAERLPGPPSVERA